MVGLRVSVSGARGGVRRGGALGASLLLAVGVFFLSPEALLAQGGMGGGGCGGGGGGGAKRKAAQLQPKVKYDKGQDLTSVSVGPVGEARDEVRLSIAYECQGRESCTPGAVQLVLAVPGRYPKHEEDREVEFTADGESVRFMRTWYQVGRQRGGDVVEVIVLTVPASDFVRLAHAGEVRCVVGSMATPFTRDQRAALEEMARRIEKGAGS